MQNAVLPNEKNLVEAGLLSCVKNELWNKGSMVPYDISYSEKLDAASNLQMVVAPVLRGIGVTTTDRDNYNCCTSNTF